MKIGIIVHSIIVHDIDIKSKKYMISILRILSLHFFFTFCNMAKYFVVFYC